MRPGPRVAWRSMRANWWCTFTRLSIPASLPVRKNCWTRFAPRSTAHCLRHTATRLPPKLRPPHPLADAHPCSDVEGYFGGTLCAEIIVADMGLARLILKGAAELAGRSNGHHVPV